MIYGIGTDIVAVRRIEAILERHGEAFARRILAVEEWAAFRQSAAPARFLARRFAAKEAFAKALGTGMRPPVSWHNISIAHDRLGKPELGLAPGVEALLAQRGIGGRHLSISDEKEMAVAFVVLEAGGGQV